MQERFCYGLLSHFSENSSVCGHYCHISYVRRLYESLRLRGTHVSSPRRICEYEYKYNCTIQAIATAYFMPEPGTRGTLRIEVRYNRTFAVSAQEDIGSLRKEY